VQGMTREIGSNKLDIKGTSQVIGDYFHDMCTEEATENAITEETDWD